uniref:Uncharacterized protein n=1 Tax=Caenorhabditis tropicalis TaxID=1561998 RepID=A0A1I7T6B8_9PELO
MNRLTLLTMRNIAVKNTIPLSSLEQKKNAWISFEFLNNCNSQLTSNAPFSFNQIAAKKRTLGIDMLSSKVEDKVKTRKRKN